MRKALSVLVCTLLALASADLEVCATRAGLKSCATILKSCATIVDAATVVAHVFRPALAGAAADTDRPFTIEPLASPAAANSAVPQLTVQGPRVILSWVESAGIRATLKFAERTASGWSAPRVVVSGDNLVVNSADVPSVRALADGTIVAHWLQENGPDPEAYNLRLSWSHDGGGTWSAPTSPHHDGTRTQHGFASLFQAPGAGLGLVWLDGRATRGDEGNMGLRTAVYGTDGKQRGEVAIDTRVCECCPTSAALTSEGPIVAYRNRSNQEIRDIYVTRLVAGRWTPPVPVHQDRWRVEACPVNGPAISARNRDVAVAWFTVKDDAGRALVAFSRDGGRTFAAPIRVDDVSSLGRVGVELLTDGSAAVGWVEFSDVKSEFKVRRVEPGGARSPAVSIAAMSGTRYPRLAAAGDELLFAWTENDNDSSRVRTARASLR